MGKVTETVEAYRLKEMKNLQAVDKLPTWRRAHGYDRIADADNQWASRPLPLTPEQFTTSLWSNLQELKDAISMPRQKVSNFISEIEQGKVSDEQFATNKRIVKRRGRDVAHATVAPGDTAHYCSPRSPTPEMSFDTRVRMEKKDEDSEKKDKGMMDPERGQLKPLSASTGLERPGQQCPPNGETGRATADGCLLVGMGSNLGGNTFFPAEIAVGTRPDSKSTTPPAALNISFLKVSRKPEDKEKGS